MPPIAGYTSNDDHDLVQVQPIAEAAKDGEASAEDNIEVSGDGVAAAGTAYTPNSSNDGSNTWNTNMSFSARATSKLNVMHQ